MQGGATTEKQAAQLEDADESDYKPSGIKRRGLRKLAEGNASLETGVEPCIAGAEAEPEAAQKPKGRKVCFWHQDVRKGLSRHCKHEATCSSCPCC